MTPLNVPNHALPTLLAEEVFRERCVFFISLASCLRVAVPLKCAIAYRTSSRHPESEVYRILEIFVASLMCSKFPDVRERLGAHETF